jgi:hypothetical protein
MAEQRCRTAIIAVAFCHLGWVIFIDDNTPTTCGGENLTQKMDAMMQMMSRMEEKCSRLETECSSLKSMLGSLKDHVDSKFDKQNEYNSMLVKNKSWKYSTPVYSAEYWVENGYDDDVARYLAECSGHLEVYTKNMRRGEFPGHFSYSDGRMGIDLNRDGEDPILDHVARMKMRPHWEEFAKALKQFTPAFGVLPDGCETFFSLNNIQLGYEAPELLKDALMNKPFQSLRFVNKIGVGDHEGMRMDSIIDIIDSNKHLRKLIIGNNRIQMGDIEKICSAVRYGSIVKLNLRNCFENGLGYDMITSLLRSGGLAKLERLDLDSNGIASNGIALLADFLATNPPLKELDLMNNSLSGDCVDLLANALRSNTSLRNLDLSGNTISDAGKESFRLALHNDSSLNSIADSNHSCSVDGVGSGCLNFYGFWKNETWQEAPASFNRAGKLYTLLSERNESISTSNVQHFGDIDVKLLPSILEAVQRYGSVVHSDDRYSPTGDPVETLSIVYEVMRKWDKVFPLYTD